MFSGGHRGQQSAEADILHKRNKKGPEFIYSYCYQQLRTLTFLIMTFPLLCIFGGGLLVGIHL